MRRTPWRMRASSDLASVQAAPGVACLARTLSSARSGWARPLCRRAASAALLGMSAAGALGVVILRRESSCSTVPGEHKAVRMADGSLIHLNTASRIEVDVRGGMGYVRLLSGEALFPVARDLMRPFVVEAGSSSVR